jgi:hypothetical protein
MNYDTEIAHTIQQYRIQTLNWNTTIEEILLEPRYERVWECWKALAYFKRGPYVSLSDAPEVEEGGYISTMADVRTLYQKRNGAMVKIQEIRKEDMRGLFGD